MDEIEGRVGEIQADLEMRHAQLTQMIGIVLKYLPPAARNEIRAMVNALDDDVAYQTASTIKQWIGDGDE